MWPAAFSESAWLAPYDSYAHDGVSKRSRHDRPVLGLPAQWPRRGARDQRGAAVRRRLPAPDGHAARPVDRETCRKGWGCPANGNVAHLRQRSRYERGAHLANARFCIGRRGPGSADLGSHEEQCCRQRRRGAGFLPLYLNAINPKIKTIKDFTSSDRIALPAVKASIQALLLQMAASQAFGEDKHAALDHLTVGLSHPQAIAALLSGTEITAHFAASPFQDQELIDRRVRRLLNSYDILGGPATLNSLYSTSTFRIRESQGLWRRRSGAARGDGTHQ